MLFQFQFQLSEGLSVLRCDTKERMCVTDSQKRISRIDEITLVICVYVDCYIRDICQLRACVCVCAPCALCRVNALQLKNTNIDHRGDYDISAESTIIALII